MQVLTPRQLSERWQCSERNIRKMIAGAVCREREYRSVNAYLNRSMVTITLSA